jgi:hypothetical protein
MIFTGTQLISKRNFYTQNSNFGVNFEFSVDSSTEKYEVGLTGSNSISLRLESGKILYNGIFLHNYIPNYNYNVFMGITDNNINISKDDIELIWGGTKETGNYDYFFFKRHSTGSNAQFDFSISGTNTPSYSIDNVGYYLNTGQEQVTGLFKNISGFDIRIFESNAFSPQNLSFSGISGFISNGQNKAFSYRGNLREFDYTQPIFTTFNTSIGALNINFKIVNTTELDKFILLDEITDFSFNSDNEINRNLSYINYSGGIGGADFPTNLFFQLSYLSGSGNFIVNDFAQNARFTADAFGNFLESGTVTGIASISTGNSNISGAYIINFDSFQWATGSATGFFSGLGTGISSGFNYTGLAYGNFTGLATGLIYDGSGTLQFDNANLIGVSIGESYSINYTGYVNATGYLNLSGLFNNDVIYVGVESTPIIKGLQYFNSTGLVSYLNSNAEHKVTATTVGEVIYLNPRFSGSLGNGIFVRELDCNLGNMAGYSSLLTGGENYGTTGNTVYAVSNFTGAINTVITGSGSYILPVTAIKPGEFTFNRTFTGSWDLYTGLAGLPLVAVQKFDDVISGRGDFQPNSSMVFQIKHQDSEFNSEGVVLLISGGGVLNPITTIISQ